MKLSKLAAALPYAHLLGFSAAKAEDDDEMKQGADESDEDYAKRMEEEDKKETEDDAKKAEDDKGKKDAKAEEGDDDEEEDDEKKDDKEQAARKSERARCAAIFKCDAAGSRPDVAAHLAFATDMSSADAIAMLSTVAGGKTRGLASRMATVQTPNVGTEAGAVPAANSPQGVAARIVAAGKKRRGES